MRKPSRASGSPACRPSSTAMPAGTASWRRKTSRRWPSPAFPCTSRSGSSSTMPSSKLYPEQQKRVVAMLRGVLKDAAVVNIGRTKLSTACSSAFCTSRATQPASISNQPAKSARCRMPEDAARCRRMTSVGSRSRAPAAAALIQVNALGDQTRYLDQGRTLNRSLSITGSGGLHGDGATGQRTEP